MLWFDRSRSGGRPRGQHHASQHLLKEVAVVNIVMWSVKHEFQLHKLDLLKPSLTS